MTDNEQWQAANNARAAIYRWFADIFAKELTTAYIADLQSKYRGMHDAFSGLGLEPQSSRVQLAIHDLKQLPESDVTLELAADFAQIFLLSGRDSAPPYASYYLESDQMLYGKPAEQMGHFLSMHELGLHPDFREPKDHISVYLQVMSVWIKSRQNDSQSSQQIAQEQVTFLDEALLNWLPQFCQRCQQIGVKTDIYPALAELLLAFVQADREGLTPLLDE